MLHLSLVVYDYDSNGVSDAAHDQVWVAAAPLDGAKLLLEVFDVAALNDGEELASVHFPDFKLVCLEGQRCNNVGLSRMPVDALDAHAAPNLRIQVETRDK